MATKRLWMVGPVLALVLAAVGAPLAAQTGGQVYTDETAFFAALSASATADFDTGASTDLPGTVSSGVTGLSAAFFDARNGTSSEATSGSGIARGNPTNQDPITIDFPDFQDAPNAIAFQGLNLTVTVPEKVIRITVTCSNESSCGVYEIGGPGGEAPIFFGLIDDANTFLDVKIEGVFVDQNSVCPNPECPAATIIDDFTWGLGSNSPTSGPDLVVDSLTHEPANPTTDDNIEFTAVVKNAGDVVAGSSTLMFAIGGETPGSSNTLFSIGVLQPGESETVVRTANLIAQSYINTATADFEQDVTESNEGNNTTTDSYTVTEPDEPPVFATQTFQILSLPAKGTLFDSLGTTITSVPYSLPDPNVEFVPDAGFAGIAEFTYQIEEAGMLSNIATGFVNVSGITCATCEGLDIEFLGTGEGSVKPFPDPQGQVVVCREDCTLFFPARADIKLQARPDDGGNTFVTWGGSCASGGSNDVAEITVTGGQTCTATFDSNQ